MRIAPEQYAGVEAAIRELTYARFEFAMLLYEDPKIATALRHVETAIDCLSRVLETECGCSMPSEPASPVVSPRSVDGGS